MIKTKTATYQHVNLKKIRKMNIQRSMRRGKTRQKRAYQLELMSMSEDDEELPCKQKEKFLEISGARTYLKMFTFSQK